jgi:hypothetical protein
MAITFIQKSKRVKLTLRNAALLRKGEEKRHHFKLELNLSEGDDTLTGLPDWMQNAYTNLIKSANLTDCQKFGKLRFENMSLEMFPTFKGKRFFSIINGATLGAFVMTRTGEGDEDAEVRLTFSAYFAGRREIHDWTFDHSKADFWMAFDSPQGELNLAGAQPGAGEDVSQDELDLDEDDEDDEDEGEDEEALYDDKPRDLNGADPAVHKPEPARTTPLVGLVARRTVGPRSVNPHN